jgi:hypothetical protein
MRDGRPIATADAATTLEHEATAPGVYRIEAQLRPDGRDRAWLLSNPVYLR